MNFKVTDGLAYGDCPKCEPHTPFIGRFDSDSDERVYLECVSCHYMETKYFHWPDDLPTLILHDEPSPMHEENN